MGEVYRAHDSQLDRDVALKVLPADSFHDPAARARLLREARSAAALNHPNICTIYEVGETDGQAYIAMELVEGKPLSEFVRGEAVSGEIVLRCGVQIADALAHAHERQIVHRDLKSANVVITREGRAKVLDFGLAKRLSGQELTEATTQDHAPASLTEPGAIAGTLAYMAPEQLRGESADARSDIWAFGVVLFEMAAGALPFRGRTGFELSSNILQRPHSSLPPHVPVELRAVIEKCLAKEPAQRYQRAGEVRAALEAIQTGTTAPWAALHYQVVRRRWMLAAVALVAVALVAALNFDRIRTRLVGGPAIHSLAVLPLENLSGSPEQDYLADGIHEALITDLSKLSGLRRVIARHSAIRYRKTDKPLGQIGSELGVEAVITGSAQRSGDRVRVTVHLINPMTEEQLWSGQYQRPFRDVLSLQDEIVAAITRQINLELSPRDRARLARARPVDPEAYDLYLKGLFHVNKRTPRDLEIALQHFQRAVEKDPNYADAYAGIANVWGYQGALFGMVPPGLSHSEFRQAAEKALELDDTSSQAHLVMARFYSEHAGEWSGAEREHRRAIELSPNDANVHAGYGHFLTGQGRFQEAEAEIVKSLELDPQSPPSHGLHCNLLLDMRRHDEAIAACQKALALNPLAPNPHFRLLVAYHFKGLDRQAIEEAKIQFGRVEGDTEAAAAVERGYRQGGFVVAMRRAAETLAARSRGASVRPGRVAQFYALAREKDRALEWLQKSFDEQQLGQEVLRQPLWDFMRSDGRFQELWQRRMKLPH